VLDAACHICATELLRGVLGGADHARLRALLLRRTEASYMQALQAASQGKLSWCTEAASQQNPQHVMPFSDLLASAPVWQLLSQRDDCQELLVDCVQVSTPEVRSLCSLPLELYHAKGECLQSFAVNACDEEFVAVATPRGIREFKASHSVLHRRRASDGAALLDEEAEGWHDSLHRFDSAVPPHQDSYVGGRARRRASLAARVVMPASLQPDVAAGRLQRDIGRSQLATSLHAHPLLPLYVSSAQGVCALWSFGQEHAVASYRSGDSEGRFSRARWSSHGMRFGALGETSLHVWCVDAGSTQYPVHTLRLGQEANDLVFLNAGSVVATVGAKQAHVWDLLSPPRQTGIMTLSGSPDGAESIVYDASRNMIMTGGREGELSAFDVRREGVVHTMEAHNLSVKSMCVDPTRNALATGSTDGDIKLWDLDSWQAKQSWTDIHHKTTFMSQGGKAFGVTQVYVGPSGSLYSCGSDGCLKASFPMNE